MRRRLACLALCAALVAALTAATAAASPSQRRPAGSPDLAAMALATTDFPAGARIVRQRYYRNPDYLASYEREFALGGARLGRSSLVFVFTELNVGRTLAATSATFASFRTTMRSRRFREALGREIARAADLDARSVVVGRPRTPRIGDGAISFAITFRAQGVSVQMAMTLLRIDRVLSSILVLGGPGRPLATADLDRLSRVSADRMRAALVPAASAPPLVTGTPTPGAALTATSGTWSGDGVAFGYQWERCTGDAPTGCSAIPGATAPTYTVTTGDLTSSLRATVSGSNRLGSSTSTSAATAFVSGSPGSPTPTVAPLIQGTVAPGARLTVTAGTWTGTPASFAYQWRRCNLTSGACVDVAGATESSYTLTAADSGSLLRVLVVATNASGAGGALSSPSGAAP